MTAEDTPRSDQDPIAEPIAEAPVSAAEPAPGAATVAETGAVLERSVRYGRLILVGGGAGAVIAMIAALLLPVAMDATYTLGQAVGFSALIGAVLGITAGALLGLLLSLGVRRSRGKAVVIHTDVR